MKNTLSIVAALALAVGVQAQSIEPQVIGSMGDHYTSTNSMLSCTAGEVMIETVSSTNSIITQGFHQPYVAGVGISEKNVGKIKVNIYPNPTFDQLNLSIEDQNQSFSVVMYDMNGKQMNSSLYRKGETVKSYDVRQWAAGHYVINVISQDGQHTASYKLQKMK